MALSLALSFKPRQKPWNRSYHKVVTALRVHYLAFSISPPELHECAVDFYTWAFILPLRFPALLTLGIPLPDIYAMEWNPSIQTESCRLEGSTCLEWVMGGKHGTT